MTGFRVKETMCTWYECNFRSGLFYSVPVRDSVHLFIWNIALLLFEWTGLWLAGVGRVFLHISVDTRVDLYK